MATPPFPRDLATAQVAWYDAYRQLTDPAPGGTAAARRRLLIAAHPYWGPEGPSPAARMALRECARRERRS
ncbi:hypothetical protein [Streptomyces sp. TLI_146]|uniref:hypothetical protein n=1 Tax=Streptomyces sp. TLI_146 TaxID=1938858 RepID=UPI000C6FD1C1|nr:hypothetical protein [Streptomyces sp. TLI_146]PKV90067.1 hypothetical protein BX283_7728 [Streptomyces sp. TLI_146]